jgi:FAD/FMN-containing dehydrogenase
MAATDLLGEPTLRAFRDRLSGELLRPGDGGYDEARALWNGRFDRRPALIARCRTDADVIAAVEFAREYDLELAVKSSGHDYAGNAVGDGGLTIDLTPMDAVRVDPATKTARVQPGARWGAFDREAQAFGLATTGGTVSTVGVAGLTLGGGSGHLTRKYGLACDNLISADLVTADGRLVHADEIENPDLFWGLRGGGGNFGVATSFEFRLHELGPEVLAGQIVHRFSDARTVLRFYRDFMADAPDELQCYAFIIHVPPVAPFPQEFHGETAIDLVVCYAGPIAEGEAALRPLRGFGDPILAAVEPTSYVALQQSFDAGMPAGLRWYSRARYLRGLPDDLIEAVLERTNPLPGPFTMVYFEPEGGAIGRIDPAATAFPHRNTAYGVHIFPGWMDPGQDAEVMDWAREFHAALAPHSTGGVYVNLLSRDEPDGVRSAYGENYSQLVELKKQWDPRNRFRLNHNITPTG